MEWALLTGLMLVGLVVLYILLRIRLDRAVNASDPAQDLRDELASVMVEINRTTEQNVVLLEDRIDQLKRIMAEADNKIRLLHRENEKNDLSRQVYTNIRRPQPRSEPMAPPLPEAPAAAQSAAPDSLGSPDHGPQPPTPDSASIAASPVEESLDLRVLRLAGEGFAAADIASRLGSTVGEVELIISLRQRRR